MGIFAQLKHGNREDYKAQLGALHRREARIRLMLATLRDLDEEHQQAMAAYLKRKKEIHREIADIQDRRT